MLRRAIIKETQLLLHDRGALLSLFLLPVVFAVTFGAMFSGGSQKDDPRRLPVYFDRGDDVAARLVAAIDNSGLFTTARLSDAGSVRAEVARENTLAGLVIPADFAPEQGRPAELVIDESSSIQVRGPIQGSLNGVLSAAVTGKRAPVVLVARTPPGIDAPLENASGFQISVPGNAVLFGFFLALTVALAFVEERRIGTWRRLLAAPVRRSSLLAAKLVPWLLVGIVQMTFLFGIGAAAFGMQVGGSVLAMAVLTVAVVACAVSLGLLIASFGGSEKQVGSVGSICLLVLGLLGGAMFPRPIMPDFMQQIGLATPHAWALDGYHTLLLRQGTGFADIAPQLAAVTGFAIVFGIVGALRFRWN